MRTRAIFVYWLLLLVPTLTVAGVLLKLLKHEQERIAVTARAAAEGEARIVADNIALTMAELKDGLLESLVGIPRERLVTELQEWERKNPLIRNVFVWDERKGLLLPPQDQPMTKEEQSFAKRYETLFSGRAAWPSEQETAADAAQQTSSQSQTPSPRQELQQLARGKVSYETAARQRTASGPAAATGWVPWFWENQLYFLAWVRPAPKGECYGVEIETASLLSRLIQAVPKKVPAGQTVALLDANGRVVQQRGGDLGIKGSQLAALPVGATLPHWQVVVRSAGAPYAAGASRLFTLLSLLMVAIFVAAVVSGGSLLLWQAHRNMQDALQKTTFVSNVSHELKTPLTTIRLYAELLGENRVKDEAKRRDYLKVIGEETCRLTRLVNNVLDFSRLEQQRKTYRMEELDLPGFLGGLIEAHRLRIEEAGMKLAATIPAEPVWMATDRDALEQVVLNLLDNAIKYGGEGKDLFVALSGDGNACRIQVMDRGPGVPPAHRERIFEKFYRVDDSLTARHPGAGLGLSIARKMMRDLGGDLTYEPRAGGGACFTIVLRRNGSNGSKG